MVCRKYLRVEKNKTKKETRKHIARRSMYIQYKYNHRHMCDGKTRRIGT